MLERRNGSGMSGKTRLTAELPTVDVGIVTRGKPTLGMTLTSLLLQDCLQLRLHIVDTGESPAVGRDDVTLAMRLAFDRGIPCSYERLREKKRGFSLGRLRLAEMLPGPHVCFVDDDMALSAGVIGKLLAAAARQPNYGCVRPSCLRATTPLGSSGVATYAPGALLRLDDTLRRIVTAYYADTVDVVDATRSSEKVWEVAFLGEVLAQLGRPTLTEPEAVIYHLDYNELNNWYLGDPAIVRRSVALGRRLAGPVEAKSLAV